jgi:FkbH-like protein
MLPDVTVLQVPAKLYLLPRLLARDGLFDTLAVSAEDRNRSAMYSAEAQRKQAAVAFGSVEEYLASLELVATIRQAREEDVARIAQLTQKTNQFNLTTRRYSSAQIEAFCRAGDAAVFSLNVRDRFGDSGLTGVLIAFREGNAARIDALLLSCRVLGRNLEMVFLNRCLARLTERWHVSEWLAEYIPSRKNAQTADFYGKAGFSVAGTGATATTYRCAAGQTACWPLSYITVKEETDAHVS